jgi:Integrase core domain
MMQTNLGCWLDFPQDEQIRFASISPVRPIPNPYSLRNECVRALKSCSSTRIVEYTAPGKPQQNAFVGSFNGRLR